MLVRWPESNYACQGTLYLRHYIIYENCYPPYYPLKTPLLAFQ